MLRFVRLTPGADALIGRDENGSLVLADTSVSRRHARVSLEGGVATIQDLGSTNGTAVNGVQIEHAVLQAGDHVEVGSVILRYDLATFVEVEHLENVIARLEAKNRDPLTGLLTRAWIEGNLPSILEHGDRTGTPSACLFADIDNFKSINDRFGHQIGDDVLVAVSRILMVDVRETDFCVRYGGEELVMFLQGSTEEAAYEVAERVRRAIQHHDWSRTTPGALVTASIGVAVTQRGESPKEWIHRADCALYAAKAAGRNRTIRASQLP
jgi:diguanylate cyclase (GGDEF)-like protein